MSKITEITAILEQSLTSSQALDFLTRLKQTLDQSFQSIEMAEIEYANDVYNDGNVDVMSRAVRYQKVAERLTNYVRELYKDREIKKQLGPYTTKIYEELKEIVTSSLRKNYRRFGVSSDKLEGYIVKANKMLYATSLSNRGKYRDYKHRNPNARTKET